MNSKQLQESSEKGLSRGPCVQIIKRTPIAAVMCSQPYRRPETAAPIGQREAYRFWTVLWLVTS